MKLVRDTHLMLWAAVEPKNLPAAARKLISGRRNRPAAVMSVSE